MFAPVVTRFVTYSVPLDPVCGAYVAAMQRWPAMQEWTAAAKAEPWVINDDVNTGAA
jgi:glutathione S-transferase